MQKTGVGVKKKGNLLFADRFNIISIVAVFLIGFALSQTVVFERFAPFAVSLVCVLSGHALVAAIVGSVLGLLFQSAVGLFVKYTGAMLLFCTLRWFFTLGKASVKGRFFAPIAAFCCCLTAGVALSSLVGFDWYDLLLSAAEAAMAGAAAFLFNELWEAAQNRTSLISFTAVQTVSAVFLFGLLVLPLSDFRIGIFSIGGFLSVSAVMWCAATAGYAAATACGLTVGFLYVIHDPELLFLPLLLGIGGLVCTALSRFGKTGVCIGMILCAAIIPTVTYNTEGMPYALYDVSIAATAFLFVPQRWLDGVAKRIAAAGLTGLDEVKRAYMTKVSFLSEALSDVGTITEQVSGKLNRARADETQSVFEKTASQICSDCGLKPSCWEKNPKTTADAFSQMIPTLKRDGMIGYDELPDYFKAHCCRSRQIAAQTNLSYAEHLAKLTARRRISEVRSVISGQFDAMASVLRGLSGEISDIRSVDLSSTRAVKKALEDMGLLLDFCYCIIGTADSMTVEFCVREVTRESIPDKVLLDMINGITERTFERPCVSTVGAMTRYVFNEQANYRAEISVLSIAHDRSGICGDSCSYFVDSSQFFNVVIADGMGKGRAAAIDSAMTVTLITKLIKAGFDYANSVKMINSALLTKSDEESLSTVDAARIDLYTGRLSILKAGAPATVVMKDKRPVILEGASTPIGIVTDISVQEQEMYLSANDLVIMMSDGVCENGYDYLLELIRQSREIPVDELTQKIADRCGEVNGINDDLTVVAVKLSTNT